ncbi:unnamed protein product [Ectocarpus sp. CCAP 1310/34]|nr:unnamed protein product [Ectocarpus sp. CCAP 1310/34]
MSLVRHLPSTRPAWRTLAGARHYVDGELLPPKPLLQSSYAAFSRQPSILQVLPSPPSRRSLYVLRRSVRPGGDPGATIALNEHASRKRLLEGRRLSTQKTGDVNNNSNNNCWKCGLEISWREHFCKCGVIQLLDERLDYFELFQCTPSVFLELKEVEMRFKNMQRAFHPDLYASKSEDEREISAANSATANKAYQTLVQPMARVKYLMRLLGSTALEKEGEDDRTSVPMDFLMEVMETREALEECSSKEEAEAVLSETSAAVEECLSGMDEVLKAGGGKDELSDAAVRLRYLYRIEDEARRVMHRLEDSLAGPTAG